MMKRNDLDQLASKVLSVCADEPDVPSILIRALARACPDLDGNEVQEYLCGVAIELERASGRAGADDSVWLTYSVQRRP